MSSKIPDTPLCSKCGQGFDNNKPVTVDQCRTMGDTWRGLGCKRGHVWLGCDTLEQAEASAESITPERVAALKGN